MKKIIIIVVVLLILGGGGAYYFFVMRAPAEPDVEQVISKKVAVVQPTDGQAAPAVTLPTDTPAPAATPATTPAVPATATTDTAAKPAAPTPAPAVASKPAPVTPAPAAKPAAPTTAPVAKPAATSAKAAFKPYIINVASFTKKSEAENLSKEIAGGGFAVYQMDFEKAGVTYYRVRVGFYASTDEAKAAGKEIVRKFPKADSPWPQKIEKSEYDKYYNK